MKNPEPPKPATWYENYHKTQEAPAEILLGENFLQEETQNYSIFYKFKLANNSLAKVNLVWDKNNDYDPNLAKDFSERVKPLRLTASYVSDTFRMSFDEKYFQLMFSDLGAMKYSNGRFVSKPFLTFNSKRATDTAYQNLWNYSFCYGMQTHAK